MPAAAQFVNHVGTDDASPESGNVLCPSQVIALIVPPEGRSGFICVVEDVAAGDLVFAGERVIDASGKVLLAGRGASCRGQEIEIPVAGVRDGFVRQERLGLRAERRLGKDVIDDADTERIL